MTSSGQEVSISSDLNVRGYFSYDLLGKIDDRILVYRDRGFNKEIDVFNQELEHTQFAEIFFEKKKVDVFSVMGLDSVFQLLYGYFDKDTMFFKMKRYNKGVVLKDSSTFLKMHKKNIRKRISAAVSENKDKILLYTIDPQERLIMLLYDNITKRLIYDRKIHVDKLDLRNDIREIVVTDDGHVIIVFKEEKKFKEGQDKLHLIVVSPSSKQYRDIRMDFSSFYRQNYFLDFDNLNKRLILCGIYSDKVGKEPKGYYFINKHLSALTGNETVYFLDFDSSLHNELLHGKKKKSEIFEDLEIKEVINRNDGGFLIVSEISREFSRRNPYNNSYARSSYNGYSRRGWIDYYNDDVLISNIDGNNNELWTEVLYKKQFSQDDEAVYSSFFVMKTPSRMRIIYNDEIKKSNTVSEYIMDPTGQIARNSLLSTEYQNMKLRFQDALQLSSNSILVPSEKNYNLNLVQITY